MTTKPSRKSVHLARRLVLAAMLAAACGAAHAAGKSAAVVELPFELVHGAVVVQVSVDGRAPWSMLFDTGADPSIIDLDTARTAGLKLATKGEQGSGGGTASNLAYATTLPGLSLGALRVRRVDAVAMDLSGVGRAMGRPIQGVLGRSLMKGRAFQIDYPKQVLRFYASSPLPIGRALPDTASRTTLRYRYRDDILLSGVTVNGRPALANLDTGASAAFQIAPNAVQRLGLAEDERRGTAGSSTGFNGSAANRNGTIEAIDVGSIAVRRPTVVFVARGTGRDDVGWSVRIGGAFLKDYAVTVDDLSHLVRIEKP